ncbi:MAG: hypothetical protein ACP5L5_11225 [Vulcanisaeta sp.]|uniref:hypothetical protein n=1 Tax=Vulcanisaeta sp. TaxID=2020871 RepID=UPI003D1471B7
MSKTYVVGKGICPKCGVEGTVVIRSSGSGLYVYIRHGRVWHYVGPMDRINIERLMIKKEQETSMNSRRNAHDYVVGKKLVVILTALILLTTINIVMHWILIGNSLNNNVNDESISQQPNHYVATMDTINTDILRELMSNDNYKINMCPLDMPD